MIFKKKLSLIMVYACLALFLINTTIPVFSKGADSDSDNKSAEEQTSEEYDVIFKLGFGDYYKETDKTITYKSGIYTILKLMGLDVANYDEDEIFDMVEELNLVKNADYIREIPKAAMSRNEILCAMVSALGYNYMAEYSGKYPSGHLKYANLLKLDDSLRRGGDGSFVSGLEFTKLLFRAFKVKYNRTVGIGEDGTLYKDDQTILEAVHGIKKAEGRVTADSKTNFYTEINSDGFIEINSVKMKNTIYDGSEFLGTYVEVWYKDIAETEIVALKKTSSNEEITIEARDISSETTARNIVYYNGKNKKFVKLASDVSVIFNGIVKNDYTRNDFLPNSGEIKLIKNSKGEYDVVIVESYSVDWVESINIHTGKVGMLYGKILDFGSDKKYDKIDIFDVNGDRMYFLEVKDDDVLMLYESQNGKYLKVIVVRQKISGKIEFENNDSSGKRYKIGNEMYYLSREYDSIKSLNKENLTLGFSGTFFLDKFGYIVAARKENVASDKYIGYVINVTKVKNDIETSQIKLFTAEGKTQVLEFADKVKFNNTRLVLQKNCRNEFLDNNNEYENSCGIKRQLISYTLNSKGQVNAVDIAYTTSPEEGETENSIKCTYNFSTDGGKRYWKEATNSFDALVPVNNETKYFVVCGKEAEPDEKSFVVGGKEILTDSKYYDIEAYKCAVGYSANYVVIYGGGVAQDDNYFVIDSVFNMLDDEGSVCKYVRAMSVYNNSKECADIPISDSYSGEVLTDDNYGDICFLTLDYYGKIIASRKILDYSNKEFEFSSYMSNGSHDTCQEKRYTYSSVFDFDGSIAKCRLGFDVSDESKDFEYYRADGYGKIVVVEKKVSGKEKIRIGTIQDIKSYKKYGNEYSGVFQTQYYNDPKGFIIYNN